jgi:hypothetical protein
MNTVGKYFLNVLIGFDVFMNAVFAGAPTQTISARIFIYKDVNWVAKKAYQFLNWLDPKHCEEAFASSQLPDDNNNAVLK